MNEGACSSLSLSTQYSRPSHVYNVARKGGRGKGRGCVGFLPSHFEDILKNVSSAQASQILYHQGSVIARCPMECWGQVPGICKDTKQAHTLAGTLLHQASTEYQ
eukprot:scaffold9386_cov21-Tisochrysis_lutea.AAC.2